MPDFAAAGFAEMLELVSRLPDQLEASADLPGLSGLDVFGKDFDEVLICGMGGSAIAGDLVQVLLGRTRSRLTVWRNYDLPAWVDHRTLVIGQSYSGNTAETISGVTEALRRSCPLIGLTSGGRLRALAETGDGFPYLLLPPDLPPRASLGLGLGGLVHILTALGVIDDGPVQLDAAITGLRQRTRSRRGTDPTTDPDGNLPVQALAERLRGRYPVIYTAGSEADPVGRRWRAQLNENAKLPAYLAEFPELDHNDLVGWDLPEADRDRFMLLILTGGLEAGRLERRVQITRDLLQDTFAEVQRISATGATALERMMSLVQYGDFLSCHLARLRGVDPMPVERIERLKTELAADE